MLHQFQTMILIGLFTQQTLLYQGIDSAKEKWRSKRSIKDLPHWPPSPSVETLLMFNEEEEVHYDLNKGIQMVKKRGPGTKKAAHCVLYSQKSKGDYRILVQLRWDGTIGFPGGFIKEREEEIPSVGLNRELNQELSINGKMTLIIEPKDFLMVHISNQSSFYLYVKEVAFEQFLRLEKSVLKAKEWGNEVLGLMLVPLVQYKDTARGLPRFLNNQFCSTAKNQLLMALYAKGILTEKQIEEALRKAEVDRISTMF